MHAIGVVLGSLLLACAPKATSAATGDDTSPYKLELHDYDVADTFKQPPNATGQFSVPSVDLTKPWPGNDSFSDDWQIYVATFSEIAAGDESLSFPTSHWLLIPEDSFEEDEIDDGWSICSFPFWSFSWYREPLEELQDDESGECAGVFPQDCIDALVARADASSDKCNDLSGEPDIESCKGLSHHGVDDFRFSLSANENVAEDIGKRVSSDNGTAVPLFGTSIPYAPKDNQTYIDLSYDRAVSQVVPYLMSYKYRDGDTVYSHSIFKCVRSDTIAEGSRVPESVGDIRSDGSSLRIPAAMLISLMTVFALWL